MAACVLACGAPHDDSGAEAAGQGVGELEERVALVVQDPDGPGRVARVGHTEYALVGAPVAGLEPGREYALDWKATTATPSGGRSTRVVLGARKVLRLVGTLSRDAGDPGAMRIATRTRALTLVGETVGAYREVAAALPEQDDSRTLYRVRAHAIRGSEARFRWLDYAPVPKFTCEGKATPELHLDLVSVKPDDSVLDGFLETRGAGQPLLGPHASCRRDGAAYACELADFGGVYGTARLTPSGAAFEAAILRSGEEAIPLSCATVDVAAVAASSE